MTTAASAGVPNACGKPVVGAVHVSATDALAGVPVTLVTTDEARAGVAEVEMTPPVTSAQTAKDTTTERASWTPRRCLPLKNCTYLNY